MKDTEYRHPANIKTLKVKSVSDEHLNLARQDSYEFDDSSSDPTVSNPVYGDKELVRRAQNDDPWAIEQLVLRYQKKSVPNCLSNACRR